MALSSDIDSLIQDIEFLEGIDGFPGLEAFVEFEDLLGFPNIQSLTDPTTPAPAGPPEPPPNLPKNDGQPIPNFEIPGDIIPKEFNITLNPIAWVLCDNGIGQIIDFVKGVVKGFLGGIKFLLDGIVSLVKGLVNLVKKGFNEVVKALKYAIRMLKEFYCTSQHIRFSISKAAPVTRPEAGLEPLNPEDPKPPKPQIYPTKADGSAPASNANYQEIFNALIRLKNVLSDQVAATIKQLQANEQARYEDLRAQLISLIPKEYREEFTDAAMTEEQKQIAKAKAEKQKYLEGIESSIAAIEKQLSNLLKPPTTPTGTSSGSGSGTSSGSGSGTGSSSVDGGTGTGPGGSDGVTVTPSTGVGPGSIGSGGVTVTPSTGVGGKLWFDEKPYFEVNAAPTILQGLIADLPPMEPFDESLGEVVPDPKGATEKNVLDQIEFIIQQGAIRTSNNILKVGANNRIFYRSLREIIDTVRQTQQQQRLQEQKDRDAAALKKKQQQQQPQSV